MSSILDDIKKLLGIYEDDDEFDKDIIIHINSVLSILKQMGVGPSEGFYIEDSSATWDDYLGVQEDAAINSVKTFIYLKVRLLFDPPQTSALLDSINRQLSELEWRLYIESGGY